MTKIRLAIHGAAGRMGRRLVALGTEDENLQITAALDAPGHPDLGADAGTLAGIGEIGVPVTSDLPGEVDALIDFSIPEGTERITALCRDHKVPFVVATTGLSEAQQEQVRQAADKVGVVWAPNMSLAVNLTMRLAEIAAAALKDHPTGADVEIMERHHRFKEDAPSGTALKFGELIAAKMGQTEHVHGRQGRPGQRPRHEIAYHALRTGDNPGEHTIVFALLGETIELRVAATNRDAYAAGALAAARFVAGKPPGLYSINDVLGL
jgi:4-hydroxy-tetrahydrodipicolinate reductase